MMILAKIEKFKTKFKYVGDNAYYKLFPDDIYYMVGESHTLNGKLQIILDVPLEIDYRGPMFTGMNQVSVTKRELDIQFRVVEDD